MEFQRKLNELEWNLLQFGVLWVFEAVAGSDGKIDDAEQKQLHRFLLEAYAHPLAPFRAVLIDLEANLDRMLEKYFADKRAIDHGLTEVGELLSRKLSPGETVAFKEALLDLGQRIAEASGGFLGFGNKVSKKERRSLARIANVLGLI